MKTLKQAEKSINTKLELLEFTDGKPHMAIASGEMSSIERHAKTIKKIKEIQGIAVEIKEAKFQAEAPVKEVRTWSENLEERVEKCETSLRYIKQTIKDINDKEKEEIQRREEQMESEARKRELKFEQEKLEQRLKYESQFSLKQSDTQQPKESTLTK